MPNPNGAQAQEGMAAWKAWIETHHAAISVMGGPLGKTKKITERGIEDVSNQMGGFMVVTADSPEAAARLFEHIRISPSFPESRWKVMPVLPIPGG